MGIKEFVLDRERRIAYKEGFEEGFKEGFEEVRNMKKAQLSNTWTKNLLVHSYFSDEKIATLVGVDIEFVKEMRVLL